MSNTNPPVRGGHAILRGVPGALTGAVHLGLVVTARALAAAAVPAVIVLRANTGAPAPAAAGRNPARQPSGQPLRSVRIWPANPAGKRPAGERAP